MVVVIIMVMGRPVVEPMLWMPMSSRGIQLSPSRDQPEPSGYYVHWANKA